MTRDDALLRVNDLWMRAIGKALMGEDAAHAVRNAEAAQQAFDRMDAKGEWK